MLPDGRPALPFSDFCERNPAIGSGLLRAKEILILGLVPGTWENTQNWSRSYQVMRLRWKPYVVAFSHTQLVTDSIQNEFFKESKNLLGDLKWKGFLSESGNMLYIWEYPYAKAVMK